jgi:hypothetical protein
MSEITEFDVPYNGWTPRPHQIELWKYLQAGGQRAMAIWHRRAGKDEVLLHHVAVSMVNRVGNYWHCLPEFNQGRKAIWTAINPHTGKRRIHEAFPPEFIENMDDHGMFLRFKNQSTFQVIGSDRYDATVGSGVAGVTYSEWALSNPSAWAYHRPMLAENNGWAAFITTPRGRNHAKTMYDHALRTPGWFAERLTVKDTDALTEAQQRETLQEMQALYGADHGLAMYRQEYECDWASALLGSFYALEMQQVREEGRIIECEPMAGVPVNLAWDLGVHDDTSIWWWQAQPSGQLLILDHYAASGVGLEHYAELIEQREKQRGWIHGSDYVPHDAKVKEWGTGRTRVETMSGMGLKPILVPLASLDDGINAVRRTLPVCVFHPRTDDGGISALEQYRREWDDEKKCFKPSAVHDWTSHPSDAFRYLAQAWRAAPKREVKVPKQEGWVIPPPRDDYRRGGIRL